MGEPGGPLCNTFLPAHVAASTTPNNDSPGHPPVSSWHCRAHQHNHNDPSPQRALTPQLVVAGMEWMVGGLAGSWMHLQHKCGDGRAGQAFCGFWLG